MKNILQESWITKTKDYKTLRKSDLKDRAFFISFIYTDMNIQMITNHPCLSILLYFIFKDTKNWIIANNPHISITENTSSENLASCFSVLSTVPYNYTYEDTPVCTRT